MNSDAYEAEIAKIKKNSALELAKRDDALADLKEKYQKLWEKSTASDSNSSPSNNDDTAKEIQQAIQETDALQSQWQVSTAKLMYNLSLEVCGHGGYSRMNSLLIHNVTDYPQRQEGENAGMASFAFCQWVVDKLNTLFESKLGTFKLSLGEIDTAHVLNTKAGKSNVVIVRFVRRIVRNLYWLNKKELKNTGVSFTEHLTDYKLNLLNTAKISIGKNNVWTNQCVIFVNYNGTKRSIASHEDLARLMGVDVVAGVDPYYDLTLYSNNHFTFKQYPPAQFQYNHAAAAYQGPAPGHNSAGPGASYDRGGRGYYNRNNRRGRGYNNNNRRGYYRP